MTGAYSRFHTSSTLPLSSPQEADSDNHPNHYRHPSSASSSSSLWRKIFRMDRPRAKFYLRLSLALNIIAIFFLLRFPPKSQDIAALYHGDSKATFPQRMGALFASRNSAGRDADGSMSIWGADSNVQRTRSGCGLCEVNPDLCEELGEGNIARAIAYSGSNDRLRRVLAKMRRGEPFNVGIVGGSVSKGHGLIEGDLRYSQRNMHTRVFNHLNDMFPGKGDIVLGDSKKSEGRNGFMNGAQGGVGTDYFSVCFKEHLTDDVDLVLVELAINDELLMRNSDSYELLIRGLLDLPSQPAVINVQMFALVFPTLYLGGDLHLGLSQFYDLPVISLRNAFLHQVMSNYSMVQDLFVKDGAKDQNVVGGYDLRHVSPEAHRITGDLINAYIDSQLCEMDRIEAQAGTTDIDVLYPSVPIPRQRALQRFDKDLVVPRIEPNCFSTNAVKHKLVPIANKGWRNWNWEEKKYIVADQPGSQVSFAFHTGVGTVQLFYLRSASFGLGNVLCWVDDEMHRSTLIEGYWDLKYNIGRAITIRDDLAAGDHVLHCELQKSTADPKGGHEFRIISVMSI